MQQYWGSVLLFVCYVISFLSATLSYSPRSAQMLSMSRFSNSLRLRQFSPLKAFRSNLFSSTAAAPMSETSAQPRKSYYISTPIYYVNGDPHIGHAYTSVIADVLARTHRSRGESVFFLSGTDEHGQKVQQSAERAGMSPTDFAAANSQKFRSMMSRLNCSNDDFLRTTESRHRAAVLALWERLERNGAIYRGTYDGWYSVRDECFYNEEELVNGRAPTGAEVQWVQEESYFFRLSQFADKLLQLYDDNPDFIAPATRRNAVLSFVQQAGGLKDLSISRTTFQWGITVPGDEKHVVYVWLDALVNYLTALGFPDESNSKFKEFWPASVHVVGKDILRFHAVFWPAFLMAAGLPLPKRVFAHGWWTKDGEKMSKSLGNVVDPIELLDRYGVDYVRYFLCSEICFGNDGDFSHSSLVLKINGDLANDVGNLLQRVSALAHRYCGGVIPSRDDLQLTTDDLAALAMAHCVTEKIDREINGENVREMCDLAVSIAKTGNRYIDSQAPWVLAKTDLNRMRTVLYVIVEMLRATAVHLTPVMPQKCAQIFDQLGLSSEWQTPLSLRTPVRGAWTLKAPVPIFPKLELPLSHDGQSTAVRTAGVAPPSARVRQSSSSSRSFCEADVLLKLDSKYGPMTSMSSEEVSAAIRNVGNHIRQLKLEKVSKSSLDIYLFELEYLKNRYQALFSCPYSNEKKQHA